MILSSIMNLSLKMHQFQNKQREREVRKGVRMIDHRLNMIEFSSLKSTLAFGI